MIEKILRHGGLWQPLAVGTPPDVDSLVQGLDSGGEGAAEIPEKKHGFSILDFLDLTRSRPCV